jgi:hypothetical protein
MSGLDDLFAQIPTQDIAERLGVDAGEVDNTVRSLVPVLVGGLQEHAQDPDNATNIEKAANNQAAQGLLDTGASQADGQNAVATLFGGNDTGQVADQLSQAGAGDSDLIQKLLPMLMPLVLSYIGKQMGQDNASEQQGSSGGGLAEVLGSILGGSGDKSAGSILGNMLGGKAGNAIGEILGGLLGGKK